MKLRGQQNRDKINIKTKNHNFGQNKSGSKIGKVVNFGGRGKYKLHSPVRTNTIYISSRFGEDRGSYLHKGLDIDGKAGDNIYAAKKGKVVSSGYTERGGNEVVIKHKNGLITKYSHLNKLNVQEGDKVTHKTVIGTMGSTGQVHTVDDDGDIAHLHYEVMKDGENINPEPFLDAEKTEYKRGDYGSGSCGGSSGGSFGSDSSSGSDSDSSTGVNRGGTCGGSSGSDNSSNADETDSGGSNNSNGTEGSNDKARDGSNVDDNNEVRGGCSGYVGGSCGGAIDFDDSDDNSEDVDNDKDNSDKVRGGCSGYIGGICSGSVPGKCGGTAIGGLEDNESISDSGIEFLKDYEKFMKTAYDDGYGYKTIGYGHVIQPDENFNSPITENKAEELLKEDLKEVENYIDENVKINLTQNQRDALTSLIFNVGTGSVKNGGIDGSKTIEKLNEGDFEGMKKEWKEYKKSNGKVSEGLVRRRADELEMFFSGDYDRDNDGVIN